MLVRVGHQHPHLEAAAAVSDEVPHVVNDPDDGLSRLVGVAGEPELGADVGQSEVRHDGEVLDHLVGLADVSDCHLHTLRVAELGVSR